MAEAKHAFVDDYPYLVYTNEDTLVYSNKTDTSIDDILGGGGDNLVDVYVYNLSEDATFSALKVNGISYLTGYDGEDPVCTAAEITEITAEFNGVTVNGATAKVPAGSILHVSVNYDGDYSIEDNASFYSPTQAPVIGSVIQALIALAEIHDFYSVSVFTAASME